MQQRSMTQTRWAGNDKKTNIIGYLPVKAKILVHNLKPCTTLRDSPINFGVRIRGRLTRNHGVVLSGGSSFV